MTNLPIALITNGSLLFSKSVRDEIKKVDVIIPTFDAGNSKLFKFINRPHKGIKFSNIITGLKTLREEFNNEIWIEVMLLNDINDSVEILEEIHSFLSKFQPDRVHINIPSRPPAEKWVKIPKSESLAISQLLLQSAQILPLNEVGKFDSSLFKTPEEAIISITNRHPLQYTQALEIIQQYHVNDPESYFEKLIKHSIGTVMYRKTKFIYQNENQELKNTKLRSK